MRLMSVELRNFGCFLEAVIDLAPATVVLGPNDSGKTTLMRAIRSLFTAVDSNDRPFDYWSVKAQPLEALDYLEDTWVLGTFGDLSPRDDVKWRGLSELGVLRGGTYFRWQEREIQLSGTQCVVLTSSQADSLVVSTGDATESFTEWVARREASLKPGEPIEENLIRLIDGNVWIPWSYTGPVGARLLHERGWVAGPALSDARAGPHASIVERMLGGGSPFTGAENLIHIRGPEYGVPSALEILKPIFRRALERAIAPGESPSDGGPTLYAGLDSALDLIYSESDYVTDAMDERYADALQRFIGHAGGVRFQVAQALSAKVLLDRIADQLHFVLTHARPGDIYGNDSDRLESRGAGTQRAAALAALELHTDPDLWDPSDWLVLLIEEPEVGLYPEAQRRLSAALRDLPKYGVQVVTVSHGPALVDSVPRDAIRVVAPGRTTRGTESDAEVPLRSHTIGPVESLQRVGEALGCSPSDILLSKRVVLVEGASDAAILKVWARTNGGDLDSVGVSVIPVGGYGAVRAAVTLMTAMMPGTSIDVVLDNGADTHEARLELSERFDPETVRTRLLQYTEIEKYFSADAIAGWLEMNEAVPGPLTSELSAALGEPKRKRALRRLAETHLGREYRVVEDGVAIAGLMREHELDPSLRALLTDLSA